MRDRVASSPQGTAVVAVPVVATGELPFQVSPWTNQNVLRVSFPTLTRTLLELRVDNVLCAMTQEVSTPHIIIGGRRGCSGGLHASRVFIRNYSTGPFMIITIVLG